MTLDERDKYVGCMLETQRDLCKLNRASTMIREVLPRVAPAVAALDEEIMRRFRVIQDIRRALAAEAMEANNEG